MGEGISAKGQCLCGEVKVKTSFMANSYGACHCGMCRKWGGGPLLAVDCKSDVQFEGEDLIGVFDSSQWAERGFCKKCGTHLFYRLKQNQQHIMPVGLFGDLNELKFGSQVFIDRKPESYEFANQTMNMTEQQIFEMYAPKD